MDNPVGVSFPRGLHSHPGTARPGFGDLHPEEPGTFAAVEAGNNAIGHFGIGLFSLHQEIKSHVPTYAF